MTAALALAFGAGMVATVNPCGFAMLPAYLSYFMGIQEESRGRAAILRSALVVGGVVSLGFLAVFAKPEELEQLAISLAPLHKRGGVWTILFPQGRIADETLWRKLRDLDWEIPFLLDQYGERPRLPCGRNLCLPRHASL